MKVGTNGATEHVRGQVYLNGLDPKAVQVELFAEGVNGEAQYGSRWSLWDKGRAHRAAMLIRAAVPGEPRGVGLHRASWYRISTAWRFPWNPLESCGSGNLTSNEML